MRPKKGKSSGKTGAPSRERRREAGHRLLDAQVLLSRTSGATIEEMMTELEVSRSTAIRYLEALASRGLATEAAGQRDGCKVHRIPPRAQTSTVAFTLEESFWQKVMEAYTTCFAGTGIDDAFQRVSEKIAATLKPKERARMLDLSRKILDVPDHVHDYSEKADVIDELLSGLLSNQPVVIKQTSKRAELRRLRIDPYTIVTHKRALYVVGFSHHHRSVRTFSIDGIVGATRLRDESFTCPADYDPRALFEGAFGLITGEETEVVIRFDATLEPWLRPRRWHATQRLEKKGRWLYLTMKPRGTTELLTWVLGWGAKATIVSPPSLRDEWRRQAEAMVAAARALSEEDERRLVADAGDDD